MNECVCRECLHSPKLRVIWQISRWSLMTILDLLRMHTNECRECERRKSVCGFRSATVCLSWLLLPLSCPRWSAWCPALNWLSLLHTGCRLMRERERVTTLLRQCLRFQLLQEMKRREWMDGSQPCDKLPAVQMTSPQKFRTWNFHFPSSVQPYSIHKWFISIFGLKFSWFNSIQVKNSWLNFCESTFERLRPFESFECELLLSLLQPSPWLLL